MKKNEMTKDIEVMTMPELEVAIDKAVEGYNATNDASERVRLEVESKKLVDRYNELAKLAVYANCLKKDLPVQELVKIHHYMGQGVQFKVTNCTDENGKPFARPMGKVKPKVINVDLFNFIEWCEGLNKKVCANSRWEIILNAQRIELNKAFAKACASESTFTVSKTLAGKVLQEVFDAIIMVPGESGANAVRPNKDCKTILVACAAEYKETVQESGDVDCALNFLKDKRWKSIIQSCLYITLCNKTVTITYGEPDKDANASTVKVTKPATNSKDTAPAKKPEAKPAEPKAEPVAEAKK